MISDGDLGLMDHLKERALVFRGEISCFQQYREKCFLPVFPFFSSFSLVDVCVCVILFLFWRGGEGRVVSNDCNCPN